MTSPAACVLGRDPPGCRLCPCPAALLSLVLVTEGRGPLVTLCQPEGFLLDASLQEVCVWPHGRKRRGKSSRGDQRMKSGCLEDVLLLEYLNQSGKSFSFPCNTCGVSITSDWGRCSCFCVGLHGLEGGEAGLRDHTKSPGCRNLNCFCLSLYVSG